MLHLLLHLHHVYSAGLQILEMTEVTPLQRKYISSGGFLSFFEILELYISWEKDEQQTIAEDV